MLSNWPDMGRCDPIRRAAPAKTTNSWLAAMPSLRIRKAVASTESRSRFLRGPVCTGTPSTVYARTATNLVVTTVWSAHQQVFFF
jgi:hypothetical protein